MIMSAETVVKPFEALPVVPIPDNYPRVKPVFLAHMAQEVGPIFALDWPYGRMVYMVGPDANRFVLGSHREHFSHDHGWTPIIGDLFGHGLLNMDGEEHARHRKMMNPAFSIAYMTRYLPIMNRVIAERTADWPDREWVDLYDESRKITFDVAAEALVGFRSGADVDRLREWFFALLYSDFDATAENEEQFMARMYAVRARVNDALLPLIAARRAHPEETPSDVLGMMINARDEEGQALSDEQLLAHMYILLIAGHETSTTLGAWLLYLLAIHPEYLARVHAELDTVLGNRGDAITLEDIRAMRILGYAFSEAGRLHSPVAMAPRGVVKDFEFGGYHIPAGTRIYYSPSGAHRLPDVFADPERFDPDRFAPPREEDKRTPYGLVIFGGGPRICIGVNMATVEIKAFAAHVLRRYSLQPLPGQDIAQLYYGVTGIIPGGIKVRVSPRP
jgi:cytochrome P450